MTATPTPTNWRAGIEGCLLVGLGTMLLRKTWDGQLPLYIHPRYVPLVLLTALAVLLIGGARLLETGAAPAGPPARRGGAYALLLAPLLLGVLIPARPAGSALLDPRQLNTAGRGYRGANLLIGADSRTWTLYDWMFARYTLAPDDLRGRPVDLVGFVYHAPGQPADEFSVTRYAVACCVADRSALTMAVRWPGAAALPDDRWVRVSGAVDLRPAQGPPELVVADAQVQPVPQPEQPYLYP